MQRVWRVVREFVSVAMTVAAILIGLVTTGGGWPR